MAKSCRCPCEKLFPPVLTDVSSVTCVGEFPPSKSPPVAVGEPEETDVAFEEDGTVVSSVEVEIVRSIS